MPPSWSQAGARMRRVKNPPCHRRESEFRSKRELYCITPGSLLAFTDFQDPCSSVREQRTTYTVYRSAITRPSRQRIDNNAAFCASLPVGRRSPSDGPIKVGPVDALSTYVTKARGGCKGCCRLLLLPLESLALLLSLLVLLQCSGRESSRMLRCTNTLSLGRSGSGGVAFGSTWLLPSMELSGANVDCPNSATQH